MSCDSKECREARKESTVLKPDPIDVYLDNISPDIVIGTPAIPKVIQGRVASLNQRPDAPGSVLRRSPR
jgi:hypothetical protein